MIYMYISIAFLSMLSGCSWWKQANLPPNEPQSVLVAENPRLQNSTVCEFESVRDQETDESLYATTDYREGATKIVPVQELAIKTDQKQKTKTTRREFKQKRAKKKAVKKITVKPEKSMADFPVPSPVQSSTLSTDTSARKKMPVTENQLKPAANIRTITVLHTMDIPMLTVKHWTGTYVPTKLTITINDHLMPIIEDGLLIPPTPSIISVSNNRFVVHYYYEFMQGMRKEENSFTYCLTDAVNTLQISFDWTTPSHLVFDHADLC